MTDTERFLEGLEMNNEQQRFMKGVAWALAIEAGMVLVAILGVWALWAMLRAG